MSIDDFNSYSDGRLSTVASSIWTDSGAAANVVAGQIVGTGSDYSVIAFYQTQVGHADHFAEIDGNAENNEYAGVGSLVRGNNSTGSPTGYRVEVGYWSGQHNVAITRYNGSGSTELTTASLHAGGSHIETNIRAEAEGSTIRVKVNGTTITSVTDSTYGTGQWTGFFISRFSGGPQPIVDNWENGTLGGGPPPALAGFWGLNACLN